MFIPLTVGEILIDAGLGPCMRFLRPCRAAEDIAPGGYLCYLCGAV
jgi:hypothetical protein